MGGWLNEVILRVFSNLGDSMILLFFEIQAKNDRLQFWKTHYDSQIG